MNAVAAYLLTFAQLKPEDGGLGLDSPTHSALVGFIYLLHCAVGGWLLGWMLRSLWMLIIPELRQGWEEAVKGKWGGG